MHGKRKLCTFKLREASLIKDANYEQTFVFADFFSVIIKDEFESRYIVRVHTYGCGDEYIVGDMIQFCYLEPIDKAVDVTVPHHFDKFNSTTIWSSVVKTDRVGTNGIGWFQDGGGGIYIQFRWKFEDSNQDHIYIPNAGPTSFAATLAQFNAAVVKRNEMKENTSTRLAYRYVDANTNYISDCDGGRFDLPMYDTSEFGIISGADYYNLGRPKYGSRPRDANSCSVYDNVSGAYALACMITNGQNWKAFDHTFAMVLNSGQHDGVWYNKPI